MLSSICTPYRKSWNRWKLAVFCLAALLMNSAFAGRIVAQVTEEAAPAAQQTAPSAQPSVAQPSQEIAKPQSAQSAQSQASHAATYHSNRRRSVIDERVKQFAASLNLNEAQQAAVKKILEQRQAEILRIRTDSAMSGSQRMERLHLLQDQTVEKIRSVLNDEQKKRYDPLAVRKVPPSSDQKSVEDWLKLTTPH